MNWEDKDYVLRLIKEFGRFLRALRDAADDQARQLLLDIQCRTACGMGLRAVDGMDDESLRELTTDEARLSLAMLLSARAEVLAKNDDERERWQGKALRLMLAFQDDGMVCRELAETADGLMRGAFDRLTAEELYGCACFFRSGGRVDLMDNAVFFLWETLPDRALWLDRLLALYEELSDETLAACGLSRADRDESLTRLRDEMGGCFR